MYTVHKVQIGNHEAWELRGPAGDGLGQFVSRATADRMAAAHNGIVGRVA